MTYRKCFARLLVDVKTWILLDRKEQWVSEPSGDFKELLDQARTGEEKQC